MASADQTTVNISRDYGLTWSSPRTWERYIKLQHLARRQVMVIMTDTTTISNAVRSIFVAVSDGQRAPDERDGQRAYLGFARSVGLVYLLEADMLERGVPLYTRQAERPTTPTTRTISGHGGRRNPLIASSIYGSTAGINLIWYSADHALAHRLRARARPQRPPYGAQSTSPTTSGPRRQTPDGDSAALLPQWRRQHPSSCGTQTAVSHLRLRRRHVDQGLHFLTRLYRTARSTDGTRSLPC
jgi:hypothetical protein